MQKDDIVKFKKVVDAGDEALRMVFPFGYITKFTVKVVPDHDVLIAGFPFQPFSHAGFNIGVDKSCCH